MKDPPVLCLQAQGLGLRQSRRVNDLEVKVSNSRTLFPYILMTKHQDVGMLAGVVAEGGVYVKNDDGLYSFWTTKSFDELNEEFKQAGKQYALILAEQFGFAHADGQLAGVLQHIS